MRNWRWYDWIIVTALWTTLSIVVGVVLGEGVAEEVGVLVGFGLGVGAPGYLYVRRLIRLARGEIAPGLSTGQMEAERIADLEQRVAELEGLATRMMEVEERMDFTERLLATQKDPRLPAG